MLNIARLTVRATAALALCLGSAPAQTADLGGVWVAEERLDRLMAGPVTLQKSGTQWVARFQGETASVRATRDGTWAFEFPDHGRFEGWTNGATGSIDGHWIQSAATVTYYPLASPVKFAKVSSDAFVGKVEPFPQDVSLNIGLINDPAEPGRYRTFLRNPQANYGVYFRIEQAIVDKGKIQFVDADGDTLATATLHPSRQKFTMVFPRFDKTMDFTRRDRSHAPGFYPRQSAAPAPALLRPTPRDDGWPTAHASDVDLDAALLLQLVNELTAFEPTSLREPYLHSMLIARKGKLVLEEYFHGYHADRTHDSRSAGKTIGSALLGIALQQGAIESIDTPLYDYYGGVDAFDNPDARKSAMTLRHSVTMSTGLNCDDNNYQNPGNEDVMQEQDAEPDWYRYALSLAMVREPGQSTVYCTAGINLLGGAIATATETRLLKLFETHFAQPLGIKSYYANLMPTEKLYLGGGLRLRPRDFLKLGQVYLNDGRWKDHQLVPAQYVADSLAAHGSTNQPDDYGFGWWRTTYRIEGRDIAVQYASGNGGQMLFVVPELDMTIMINAGNYGDGRTRAKFRDRFLSEFILPAAM
ncbi:MAG: serine hydrolase [Pseudomonadota bacterium]